MIQDMSSVIVHLATDSSSWDDKNDDGLHFLKRIFTQHFIDVVTTKFLVEMNAISKEQYMLKKRLKSFISMTHDKNSIVFTRLLQTVERCGRWKFCDEFGR